MNTMQNKSALKVLALTLLMLPFLAIAALQAPWYHDYFHNLNGAHYEKNCSLIDFGQKIRELATLAYYRVIYKKADIDQALSSIQARLEEFKIWLLAQEQETLLIIKEKYGMNDAVWHTCLSDMEQLKNNYQNGMMNAHVTVTHDQNIPNDIKKILTTVLQQNNIHPSNINLTMITDQKEIDENANVIARARTFVSISTKNNQNNELVIEQTYIPSSIEVFPRIIYESEIKKMSFCAHEVQHLVSHHSITELVMIAYLVHYCSIDEKEFKQTPEYRKLSQIHEAQAEILSALKSPEIARCMKDMRKNGYYPNHLYEEHFCHLATIDMLWKVHAQLECFNQ